MSSKKRNNHPFFGIIFQDQARNIRVVLCYLQEGNNIDIRVEVAERLTELLVSVGIQASKDIQDSIIGILGPYKKSVPRRGRFSVFVRFL